MATWDDLKNTFFDECREALESIEAGFTAIRNGTQNADTINAVFRAVHSVKGGAGVFGFEFLVGFAHVFETVLDALRQETLSITPEIIEVLLGASDVLTDLVETAQAGREPAAGFGDPCKAALQRLLPEQDGADDMDTFDGIDFIPVMAADEDAAEGGAQPLSGFRVAAGPMIADHEQAVLECFRELRQQYDASIAGDDTLLPAVASLDPGGSYLAWSIDGAASQEQLAETLSPLVDVGALVIVDRPAPVDDFTTGSDAMMAMPSAEAPPLQPEQSAIPVSKLDEAFAEPREPVPAKETPAAVHAAPATIRVDLDKIDRVVNMVGELVIAQAMLGQIVEEVPEIVSHRLTQVLEELFHYTRELKSSVMSMRAQPVRSVFQRMTRLVRDLSTKTGKRVELEMVGENTEVDKTVIERLSDPLTHIIRNSVDHGLESPQARLDAGKDATGCIRLSADQRGGRIVIEIADDGAEIDSEKVLCKARDRGLVAPDAVLTEDEVNNLIFLPGFSTAEIVSDLSGRGVGMDVVRRNIQDLGGRITLKSERGKGMTIQLALPLTLAVMDGMIFKSAGETYVMPISSIVECIRTNRSDTYPLVGTRGTMRVRENIVPLVYLSDIFNLQPLKSQTDDCVVIIVEVTEGDRIGLVVDELCGHQQVVIKSIEENWESVPGIAAATILGNGRVAFIVDVEKLFDLEPVNGRAQEAIAAQPVPALAQ